jgi:hypothetical protein
MVKVSFSVEASVRLIGEGNGAGSFNLDRSISKHPFHIATHPSRALVDCALCHGVEEGILLT